MGKALIMGASGKIGFHISKALLLRGHECILQCRHHCTKLSALSDLGNATVVKHDFLEEGVDSFLEKVASITRSLSYAVLIQPKFGQFKGDVVSDFSKVIELNLKVPSLLMIKLPDLMVEGGTILMLMDLTGLEGANIYRSLKPSFAQVIASAGLKTAVETAPQYLKGRVKVLGVALGWMDLPTLREEDWEAIRESVPLGRPGKVEELLNLVMYLLEKAPNYLDGSVIRFSGGL